MVTALVVPFLAFDGSMRMLEVAPVMQACGRVGLPASIVVGIGAALVACTALYAVPRTAVVGALLVTAFLGGAVATHVRAGSGSFEIAFAVGVGPGLARDSCCVSRGCCGRSFPAPERTGRTAPVGTA